MGLGNLLHDITNGVTLGGMDMSILSTIALPEHEAQQKYEAMGLPDPVAFAALIALGAIPDPMAMLNAMMLKAGEQIQSQQPEAALPEAKIDAVKLASPLDREADCTHGDGSSETPRLDTQTVKFKLPGMAEGKSFVEAFRDLEKSKEEQPCGPVDEQKALGPASGYLAAAQLLFKKQEDHAAKQGKEALEQAKVAVNRAREVAQGAAQSAAFGAITVNGGTQADSKGVAQVFSGGDEDLSAGKHIAGSLSALLSGTKNLTELQAAAPPVGVDKVDKICISKLPSGVTEAAVRLECARHGAITSVVLQGDGSAAYVTYANAEMALSAMRRILGRAGALGSSEPLDVRLVAEIPEHVRVAPAQNLPEESTDQLTPSELPEYLRPKEDRKKEKRSRSRKKSRSKSRQKKRSKSRKKRRRKKSRSKSRDRWLDRSRSNSHTATGQYIRATGCTSSVRPWQKKAKASSSSSRSSRSKSKGKAKKSITSDDKRPRQLSVQGCWAQFQFQGNVYYYNIQSGQTQWDKPKDFEASSSRRYREVPPATQASKSATGCLI